MRLPPADEIERHVLAMPQVAEGVDHVAAQVEQECTQLAYERAWDLGEYAGKIHRIFTAGIGAIVRAADRKSAWIERGTGIYGPEKRPIRPKRGKFLVFRVDQGAPRGSMSGTRTDGTLIFAREVKGRPASHVMRDGSKAVAERLGLRWRDLDGGG